MAAWWCWHQPWVHARSGGQQPSASLTSCPPHAGLHGGTNILEQHCGSPIVLLLLMQIFHGGFWMALFSLYARLPVRFNAVALPLVAVLPVRSSRVPAMAR